MTKLYQHALDITWELASLREVDYEAGGWVTISHLNRELSLDVQELALVLNEHPPCTIKVRPQSPELVATEPGSGIIVVLELFHKRAHHGQDIIAPSWGLTERGKVDLWVFGPRDLSSLYTLPVGLYPTERYHPVVVRNGTRVVQYVPVPEKLRLL